MFLLTAHNSLFFISVMHYWMASLWLGWRLQQAGYTTLLGYTVDLAQLRAGLVFLGVCPDGPRAYPQNELRGVISTCLLLA